MATCSTVLALAAAGAWADVTKASTPYVDGHAHFDESDVPGSIEAALAALDRENGAAIVFQIPPEIYEFVHLTSSDHGLDGMLAAARSHPGKLAVLAGGGTLNAMIQACPPSRVVRTSASGSKTAPRSCCTKAWRGSAS